MYASENRGYTASVWDTTNYVTYADTLTILTTRRYAKNPFPLQPATAVYFEPDQDLKIFRDLDVPSDSWYAHSCAYIANVRALGANSLWDLATPSHVGLKARQLSGIHNSSNIMVLWCGPCNVNGGVNYGVKEPFPDQLDNYLMWSQGNGLCNPPPAGVTYAASAYSNPIALGTGIAGNPSSRMGRQCASVIPEGREYRQ